MPTTYDFTALSLREKAALTPDQIRKDFLAFRLMERGIAPIVPPLPVPVPDQPIYEMVTVYELLLDGSDTGVAFEDPEAIEKIMALRPIKIGSDWTLSYHHKMGHLKGVLEARRTTATVQGVPVVPAKDWKALTEWGAEAKKAVEKNEEAEKQHRNETEAIQDILDELMDDWRKAVQTVGRFRGILETKANYERMAGDPAVARKFLLNTFPEHEVNAAEEFAAEETGERSSSTGTEAEADGPQG